MIVYRVASREQLLSLLSDSPLVPILHMQLGGRHCYFVRGEHDVLYMYASDEQVEFKFGKVSSTVQEPIVLDIVEVYEAHSWFDLKELLKVVFKDEGRTDSTN